MRGPHNILRLVRIGATMERTGALAEVLETMNAPPWVGAVARLLAWPFKWSGLEGDTRLPPVPRALTALGPAYIKFGQILSTRPDVVGPDLALELRFLLDKLPPFPTDVAKRTVEEELRRPWKEMFSDFSEPIAAASIAQVHKAHLRNGGAPVAVKILRPGIEKAFRRDIDAFHLAAWMIELLSPASRRLRPTDVVQHFEGVVLNELDLRVEAAAASEFAALTAGDAGFHVPETHFSLSAKRAMTLGWAEGIPLGDLDAIDAAGHDRKKLGDRLLQLFLSHALRDGFFHSDMHQGNLKVAADGDLLAVDFGIMGRIDEYTRRVYAEILFGFIRRDYRRVAEVHFEAGYVPLDRDIDAFAQALRSVGEPIFGMDATQISMGRLLTHLFEVTERFGMQTRTELILLQRTMVVVEGVARSLNPESNFWEVAGPIVEDYIRDHVGPEAFARDLAKTARIIARFGPVLPDLIQTRLVSLNAATPRENNRFPAGWLLVALASFTAGIVFALIA